MTSCRDAVVRSTADNAERWLAEHGWARRGDDEDEAALTRVRALLRRAGYVP